MDQKLYLRNIAYARSGDKGSNANIGVIAYTEAGFDFLQEYLSEKMVFSYLNPLGAKKITRYELKNLWALNFVLFDILAGGGSSSLRIDSQGKTLGQVLLEMPIKIPSKLIPLCSPQSGE